jgi:site-specific DNA recombinase
MGVVKLTDHKANAVILARVSSKSQEDEGYSLDSQLKLLTGYCEAKDLRVVRVFKIAETASKEQSRKVFHEMLAYISTNHIFHLTVEKTDRFTRNFRDAVAIDDWLEADPERRLHAVKENLLLHKEAKSDVKFMWNIHLSVAKKYSDNLREEAMKGWAEKLAQGWLPGVPPPGYVTITQNGKRIHVPNPETRTFIVQAFKLYLDPSQSCASLAREMAIMGIRTRKGRPYAKSKVQAMLLNQFYIGVNHHNGKDYPGVQETFISRELFDKVQQKLHRRRPTVLKKHNPVFKNIIQCAVCGGLVTWQLQKGRYYGACQRKGNACKGRKLLREDTVEEMVVGQLQQLVCPAPEIIDWVAAEMREEHKDSVENRDRMLASIESQIGRLQRMDSDLYDDKLAGDIAKEKYDVKHAEFTQQLAELEDKRGRIDATVTQGLEQRLVIMQLAQKAAQIYQNRTPEQKRLIITKLFASVTANNGIVSVKLTNFSRAIAKNVLKTTNLLGGQL